MKQTGFGLKLTLEGLKLAAAIGTPRTVKVANQRPPSRRKNEPGLNSAHEYKIESFKDEYSFTCQTHKNASLQGLREPGIYSKVKLL